MHKTVYGLVFLKHNKNVYIVFTCLYNYIHSCTEMDARGENLGSYHDLP